MMMHKPIRSPLPHHEGCCVDETEHGLRGKTSQLDQTDVFAFLQEPRTHGLSEPVIRIDTHGASVFLAGQNVYKVKRAVRFPFMDFSTLEKRRTACESEIRVNRANAPDLYLGTIPITVGHAGLQLGGRGQAVDWAVHLRRFDETATLDRLADKAPFGPDLTDKIARAVLASHQRAPLGDVHTATRTLRRLLTETINGLAQANDLFPPQAVTSFGVELTATFDRVTPLLHRRAALSQVRHCHGDLHLGNLVLINDVPVLFDALEFDDDIATCDILYDLAFLVMDLCERNLRADANHLLNRYLALSADEVTQIEGLAAFPVFLSLRAAIRAKVIAAQLCRDPTNSSLRGVALRYFWAAADFLAPTAPILVAIGGLSGTGKSSLAMTLAPELSSAPGALHLRSDIERKRLCGFPETYRLAAENYNPMSSGQVYTKLNALAAAGLRAGRAVIVDATHQRPAERAAVSGVAAMVNVPFVGVWLDGTVDLLVRRVMERVGDASDATTTVVLAQAKKQVGVVTWCRLDARQTLAALKLTILKSIPCADVSAPESNPASWHSAACDVEVLVSTEPAAEQAAVGLDRNIRTAASSNLPIRRSGSTSAGPFRQA